MDFERKKPEGAVEEREVAIETSEKIMTQEDLRNLENEKLSSGRKVQEDFLASSRDGIDNAVESIGLSPEKSQAVKGQIEIEGKAEKLNETAKEAYERLESELDQMFADGNFNPDEVSKKIDERKDAHNRMMEERRRQHEEEMKRLDDLSNNEEKMREARENAERQIFGGKTLEEAKRDADNFLEEMKRKQRDFINNPTNSKVETSSIGQVRETPRAINELDDKLKKSSEEYSKQLEDMSREFSRRLEEQKNQSIEDARRRNQQMEGEEKKVKVCPKCGRESEMSANFCGSCGNKLEKEEEKEKKEIQESNAEKIKKVTNFPDLFEALKKRGPVKNSFDVENGNEASMVSPETAIEVIKGFFSENPTEVVKDMRAGKRLSFLKEDGVRDKVLELFEKAI